MSLSPQREIFAINIAFGKNQSEAYRIAFPRSKKWKEESVWQKASHLMADVKVQTRVAQLQEENLRQRQAELDEILIAMTQRVRLDIRSYFKADGSFLYPHEMNKEQAMCLQEFQVEEIWAGRGENRTQIGVIKKVKFIDLKGLWDMFMKKFGAYAPKKIEIDEDLSYLEDLLEGIKK